MTAFTAAQEIVAALADTIPDIRLRTSFVHEVATTIPARYRISARAAAKARDERLTRREHEVVTHIARGTSNREIAPTHPE